MTRLLRRSLASLLTLAVLPAIAAAQSSPVVGTWTIEWAAGMRVENDVPTPIMATGTLTITEVGDSLVATLKTDPIAGMPPRPEQRFATAKVAGSTVTFIQTSQARISSGDGDERTVTARTTWEITATGDVLSGSLSRRLEGMETPGAGPQPLKGKRA